MFEVIFDMETSDLDDFITLCWLANHPQINLVGVTVTPGTKEQIGLVKQALAFCDKEVAIGSFDPDRETGCVSSFHYTISGIQTKLESADGLGADVIASCLRKYPNATLLTGGPLKNLHCFLETHSDVSLQHWVGQGGFAGDSLVVPEHRLSKFAGRETCPTFNFNGDPQGALLALSSKQIQQRTLVSKNVCHRVLYDQIFHTKFTNSKNKNLGMKLIYLAMTAYLARHPKGKMLHDPLAASVIVQPDICSFTEVEVYRSKGEWGSRKCNSTGTKISVSVDIPKFTSCFTLGC